MDITLKDIEQKHPSICYSCDLSRKPASDENTKKGYVGCCMRVLSNHITGEEYGYDWYKINSAKEVAEGWVDLKSRPKLGKGSGIISNLQILTLETKSCDLYKQLNENG